MKTSKNNHHHGRFLKRLLELTAKKMGMSPDQWGLRAALARKLNVPDSTIQRWFEGCYPSRMSLVRLHQELGIMPHDLFGLGDKPLRKATHRHKS